MFLELLGRRCAFVLFGTCHRGAPRDGCHESLVDGWHVQLQDAITTKSREVAELESQINEIVDRIYKDFSASVGVANIREYEENQLRAAQEIAERRMALNSQISKLKNQ